MSEYQLKQQLHDLIDGWVNELQNSDDALDMWVSDSLTEKMADAALAVLTESLKTQEWLKREGHIQESQPQ